MNWELESVLEQSISQIAEGKARVESCLLAYPALADELGPLLRISEGLLAAPKPVLSPQARDRIEAQILQAAVAGGLARREKKPRPQLRLLRFALPTWRPAYSALAAVVIVVLLMATTLVGAANALPGSPLYPIKLATEDAWLWVAPARNEPALHLRFAQRRLVEYQKLAERGVHDETVLEAMTAEVEAALAGIEALPPALALAALDQAEAVVAGQQQALAAMRAVLPTESRLHLDQILKKALAQMMRMQTLRLTLLPYATATVPVLDLTPTPTGTLEPGGFLAATSTPTSSLAPGEIEETPPTTGTQPASGATATVVTGIAPTATSVPTATSAPPPTPTPTPSEGEPTKQTPPGLTKTPLPPGLITRTPYP